MERGCCALLHREPKQNKCDPTRTIAHRERPGEDEERGIYKPWSFIINKYSEFDDSVDIEELNDRAMYFYPMSEEERY